MVKFLIHRPVAVMMTFLAITMLGLVASRLLPVSLMPDIDIPEITVSVSRPNMSAREIESTMVTGLRRNLSSVPGLRDMKSESRNGSAIIRLLFEYGSDLDIAFMEVNERVMLPGGDEPPRIIKASATDLPVYMISLNLKEGSYSEDRFMELSEVSETIIKRRIEQLPEVAMADITGTVRREVFIEPDQAKMRSFNITDDNIINAINLSNREVSSINIKEGHYVYTLLFSSVLTDVNDIKSIFLRSGERVFKLEDVAKIGVRTVRPTGFYYNNNNRAINMAIIKNSASKMSDMDEELDKLIASLERSYPQVHFEKSQDQTTMLEVSIANLKQNLLLGGSLAFLVMFFFLRDAKSPFLIGLSIPASLIISLLFFHLTGLTINIISLSGLILGVGMMIDNSIIVTDNICQYIDRGEKLAAACIKGTNEVIRPLISSVMTTCAVFLPLIFLSGMAGALFYDQAIAITIGLFVSLIVSITLLPTAYRLFYLRGKEGLLTRIVKKISFRHIEDSYEKGMAFFFRFRIGMLILFMLILGSVFFLYTTIEKEKFPRVRYDEIVAKIDWNENVDINESRRRIEELNGEIAGYMSQINAYIGEQRFVFTKGYDHGYSEARIYYRTKTHETVATAERLIYEHIHLRYPGAVISVAPQENIFEMLFEASSAPLTAEFSMMGTGRVPDTERMIEITERLRERFPEAGISVPPLEDRITIRLDQERALIYDIPSTDFVYNRLRTSFNDRRISELRRSNELLPIVLTDREMDINEVLTTTFIPNRTGMLIPVRSLVTVERTHGYKTIRGGRNSEFVPVDMQVHTRSVSQLTREIRSIFIDEPDITMGFSGALIEGEATFMELLMVLSIALLLLFFILAAQFESLKLPFIVLLEIPIDIAGALLMLKLFGGTINLMSMIGIIVMAGIIINDSIIKIDTINRMRLSGAPLMKSIYVGGARRLKPIIMTSITTILATMPFLFRHDLGSELQTPLALAVIGGMALGTFVSLYFIPLAYWFLYRNSEPIPVEEA